MQGHKGLVGNCGRLLQESGVTTLADWERVSSVRLLRTVGSLRSYGSIARSVREQSPEERAVLLGVLLTGRAVICTADRRRLTGSMVSDGLLSASKEVDFYSYCLCPQSANCAIVPALSANLQKAVCHKLPPGSGSGSRALRAALQ